MNDFTKEELIQLSHLVGSVPMDDVFLLHKIQSLIAHYCEHDPEGDYHVCVDKCSKCGVICE